MKAYKGAFKTYIYLDDESEVKIRVSYLAEDYPAKVDGPLDECYPSASSIQIDRYEVISSPMPVNYAAIEAKVKSLTDKLIDEAWDDFSEHKYEN